MFHGPPNTRLKLSAPAPNDSLYEADVRCGRILFVNSLAWRRGLSAIR